MAAAAIGVDEVVRCIGRTGLSVVVVSRGDAEARAFLATGAVARVYCVDPTASGIAPRCDDRRLVPVYGPLATAVSSGKVPGRADVACFGPGCAYPELATDVKAAASAFDFVVGHSGLQETACISPDVWLHGGMWISRRAVQERPRTIADVIHSRFDKILCLTCPQSAETRLPGLMSELSELGVADMALPFPNVHSAFAHAELDRRVFANQGARKVNVKNCMLGHYSMVRFAYDAGYSNVMLIEDDCRFVRPDVTVAMYLDSLPASGNSSLYYNGAVPSGSGSWRRLPAGSFFDYAVCYTLGRDGMGALVDYYEKCGLKGCRWPVDAADRIWPYLTGVVGVYVPNVRLVTHGSMPTVIGGVEV